MSPPPGRAGVLRADGGRPAACGHVQRHALPARAAGPRRAGDRHHAQDTGDHLLLPESCLPGELVHMREHAHTPTHSYFNTHLLAAVVGQ